MQDGRERIQERRGLVRQPRRDGVEVRPDDTGRDAKELRECAPCPVGVGERAEVRHSRLALAALPARARDPRHDPVSDPEGLHRFTGFHDLAARLVTHRHGKRDLRVTAREELDVGPARERRSNAEHHFSPARARHREIPLLEGADRGLDERAHGAAGSDLPVAHESREIREPAPAPGRVRAAAIASSIFSRSHARERSNPHTAGKVSLSAAESEPVRFPSVAASASTSSRSSLIWKARPRARP